MRLLHFTDSHLFAHPRKRLWGVNTRKSLQAAVGHAKCHCWPCAAILVTGDIVHDEPRAYGFFIEEFGSLGVPVLCLPGNHDVKRPMWAALRRPPFEQGPLVRLGEWSIILLDSVVADSAAGRLSRHALEVLDSSLELAGSSHVVVSLHHHPVPVGSAWLDQIGLCNSDALFAALDRRRGVRALIWGHIHQEFVDSRRGVMLMGTPSTGVQFACGENRLVVVNQSPGYRWIKLQPNGSVSTDVVWVDGPQNHRDLRRKRAPSRACRKGHAANKT
jgi:3',5'-cyclic-AMP phosphodiesterase